MSTGVAQIEIQTHDAQRADRREIGRFVRTIQQRLSTAGGHSVAAVDCALSSTVRIPNGHWSHSDVEQSIHTFVSTKAATQRLLRLLYEGENVHIARFEDIVDDLLGLIVSDKDCALAAPALCEWDNALEAHAIWTSILVMALGIDEGFDRRTVNTLGLAGLLHDVGMQKVPQRIRDQRRTLQPDEIESVYQHPFESVALLRKVVGLPPIVSVVAFQTHEQPNGGGYPNGLCAEEIHRFSHLVRVADEFVAVSSPRPHRPAAVPYVAVTHLLSESQSGVLDARAARRLLRTLGLFPPGSHLAMSDGRRARVIRSNPEQFSRPTVSCVDPETSADIGPVIDLADSGYRVWQALPTPGRFESATILERTRIRPLMR